LVGVLELLAPFLGYAQKRNPGTLCEGQTARLLPPESAHVRKGPVPVDARTHTEMTGHALFTSSRTGKRRVSTRLSAIQRPSTARPRPFAGCALKDARGTGTLVRPRRTAINSLPSSGCVPASARGMAGHTGTPSSAATLTLPSGLRPTAAWVRHTVVPSKRATVTFCLLESRVCTLHNETGRGGAFTKTVNAFYLRHWAKREC